VLQQQSSCAFQCKLAYLVGGPAPADRLLDVYCHACQ